MEDEIIRWKCKRCTTEGKCTPSLTTHRKVFLSRCTQLLLCESRVLHTLVHLLWHALARLQGLHENVVIKNVTWDRQGQENWWTLKVTIVGHVTWSPANLLKPHPLLKIKSTHICLKLPYHFQRSCTCYKVDFCLSPFMIMSNDSVCCTSRLITN